MQTLVQFGNSFSLQCCVSVPISASLSPLPTTSLLFFPPSSGLCCPLPLLSFPFPSYPLTCVLSCPPDPTAFSLSSTLSPISSPPTVPVLCPCSLQQQKVSFTECEGGQDVGQVYWETKQARMAFSRSKASSHQQALSCGRAPPLHARLQSERQSLSPFLTVNQKEKKYCQTLLPPPPSPTAGSEGKASYVLISPSGSLGLDSCLGHADCKTSPEARSLSSVRENSLVWLPA